MDVVVVWILMIGIISSSHLMEASRWVSNLFNLIQDQMSRNIDEVLSSLYLNWLRVRDDSILCCVNFFWFESFKVESSVREVLFVFASCRKLLLVIENFRNCNEFYRWVKKLHCDDYFLMDYSDVDDVFPDFWVELNSTMMHAVCLPLTILIYVACLIMRSRMRLLYIFMAEIVN